MRGNPIFGDWSGIPRGDDADRIDPPIGTPCLWCDEPIRDGELGEILGSTDEHGSVAQVPIHRECLLLGVIGHRFGVCVCTKFAGAPSARAAALEVDRRIRELGSGEEELERYILHAMRGGDPDGPN